MLGSQERVIGGVTYKVFQLGALTGRAALVRLVKLMGGALSGDRRDVGSIIAKVAESLSESDVAYFCDLFAPQTTVTTAPGKSPKLDTIFDLHFAGKYMELFEWLRFCVEVNFGNVFTGLASAVARVSEKGTAAQSSESPSPLTGMSTES